jgi:hypothetical protein
LRAETDSKGAEMWAVVRTMAGVAAAAVIAGTGLTGAWAATGSGPNLLPNGSFDNGSISGWGATNAKLTLATPGYGGSPGALEAAWNGSGSAYTVWASPQPAGDLTVGTQVVASGEVTGVAGRKICMLLQEHGTAQTVQKCGTATGSWQTLGPVTLTDKTAGDSVGLLVRQYGAQPGDSFQADSLSVAAGSATASPTPTTSPTPTGSPTPTTSPTPTGSPTATSSPTATPTPTDVPGNLLSNGTFDSGSTSGWKSSGGSLTVTQPGYGGTPYAAKITYNGTSTSYNLWADPKPVTSATAGEQLQANGYVLGVAGRYLCLQLLEHSSASGSVVQSAQACLNASGGWQPIGPVNLTVKNAGDWVGYVIHQTGTQSGDYFQADSLSLVQQSVTQPPPPAVVAQWDMDETSGTTMHDSSGNGNNGTLQGGMQIGVPGYSGTAYYFPGSSAKSYVDVPPSPSLNPGSASVDISFWMNTTKVPSSGDYDLVRQGVYPYEEYKTELQPNGQISCAFHGSSNTAEIQGGPALNDGAWHHIECIKDATGITLYVDGSKVASQTASIGSVDLSSSELTVGSHGTYDWYQGKLDAVTISYG